MKYLILPILFLISCSPAPENTKAKISIASVTGSANYAGGLYLFAKSYDSDLELIKRIPDNDSINLVLPNGLWRFKVVGWDGGAQNKRFEGSAKCAYRFDQALNGSDITLNLALSPQKCYELGIIATQEGLISNPSDFYNPATGSFQKISIGSCIDLKSFLDNGYADKIPDQIGCGGPSDVMQSDAKSYRVTLMQKDLDGSVAPGLLSECRSLATPYRNYTGINLPPGGMDSDIRYAFTVFNNATCTGAPVKVVNFDHGISTGSVAQDNQGLARYHDSDGNAGAPYYSSGDATLFIALNADACTADQLDNVPFAAGDTNSKGGKGAYLICTAAQWQNIALGAGGCPSEANGVANGTMDCQAEASYKIGRDIDFGGSNTTIGSPFTGELRGTGYRLLNGNSPLFDTISSPSTADDQVYISDLTIENFNITSSSQYAGVLANQVTKSNDTDNQGVEIGRNKLINSSIVSTFSGSQGAVGGFIGAVNFDSPVQSSEYFSFRYNHSDADVSSTYEFDSVSDIASLFATGGLIGKIEGPTVGRGGGAYLELNSVGYDHESDIQDPSDPIFPYVQISGATNVGGIVGAMRETEVRFGNVVKVDMRGKTKVGGLVGATMLDSSIENSISIMKYTEDTSFCTADQVCIGIGGVLGIKNAGWTSIEGTVSSLEVGNTTYAIDEIGGLVGRVNDGGGPNNFQAKHVRTMLATETDGAFHGGFIGYGNLWSGGDAHIDSSVAAVDIRPQTPGATNSYRGGATGKSGNAQLKRVIITGIASPDGYVEGYQFIGGVHGDIDGFYGEEIDVNVQLVANEGSQPTIGGYAGVVNTGGTNPQHRSLKINAEISLPNYTAGSCAAAYCGVIVGNNIDSGAAVFQDVIALGTIEDSANADMTVDCGTGGCSGTELVNIRSDDATADCTALSGAPFIDDGGVCSLTFEQKWFEVGFSGYYRAGSLVEPFEIFTPQDWNKIGDDALLVSKSYEVMNDLDFGGVTPVPIGNDSNSNTDNNFSGTIFGDNVYIENMTLNTGSNAFGGVINSLNDGRIGLRNKPLHFYNLSINCNATTSCGLVGVSNSGSGPGSELFVLNLATIIDGSSPNTGGLVGEVFGQLNIETSVVSGSVETSAANAGGMIGTLGGGSSSSVGIRESGVDVDYIGAGSHAGGFIGYAVDTGGGSSIEKSYVWLDVYDFNSGNDISAAATGGIAGAFGTNMSINTVYVDQSMATLPGGYVTVGTNVSGTPSINSMGIVGAGGGNDGTWSHTFQASDYSDLKANISSFSDDDRWVGFEGRLVRAWEVEGFDH